MDPLRGDAISRFVRLDFTVCFPVFGLALVFNGVLLINKEGWAKRYALLLAVGIFILLMDLLFLLNYFVFHHYLIWRFMRLMSYFIIYFGVVLILFFVATTFTDSFRFPLIKISSLFWAQDCCRMEESVLCWRNAWTEQSGF